MTLFDNQVIRDQIGILKDPDIGQPMTSRFRSQTRLTNVTAVVPLQKQSIFLCILSSLSMTLKAFKNDSFSVWKISTCFSVSSSSAEVLVSSPADTRAVSPGDVLSVVLVLISLTTSSLFRLTLQWARTFSGRESLTLFATKWPYGPCPSKTPQNIVSVLDPKF